LVKHYCLAVIILEEAASVCGFFFVTIRICDVRSWHETDMAGPVGDVRSWGWNRSRISGPEGRILTLNGHSTRFLRAQKKPRTMPGLLRF
jgi:hypothetical protein